MEPVLRLRTFSCRIVRAVSGSVQIAIEALQKLPILADEDHPLADIDILDCGHRTFSEKERNPFVRCWLAHLKLE